LSWRTVARRLDSIADDLKLNLTDVTKQFECFSIALDESTDSSDTAQLTIFIRGIDTNFNNVEELLSLQPMKYTTKGDDIFQEIEKAFETFKLNWEKLSGVATDGTPSMVGSKSGVVAKIQSELSSRNIKNENFLVFHCILHQQNLCVKSVKFKEIMKTVVSCVNYIKSKALNHRQFKQFLEELETEYGDLLYYCEVRWLSKGNKQFFQLKEEIYLFMDMKEKHVPELKDENG
jgi:hypothetical protein